MHTDTSIRMPHEQEHGGVRICQEMMMLPPNVLQSRALEDDVPLIANAMLRTMRAGSGHREVATPPPSLDWQGMSIKSHTNQLAKLQLTNGKRLHCDLEYGPETEPGYKSHP